MRSALMLGLLMAMASSAFAYSDRIDASPQEIYEAAKVAFAKEGFVKQDAAQASLTTKWIYTTIRRSRNRKFVPLNLKENVKLRYRMQIDIAPGKNYSEVSVQGRFEEKATDAPPAQPWKHSYSSKELYFKEREAFIKILTALEAQKKALSTPAPQAT